MKGDTGETIYLERLDYGFWLPFFISVTMLGLLGGVIAGSLLDVPAATIPCACLIVVFAVVYFLAGPLTFRVTPDEVVFGFPFYRKRMARSALVSCEPFELRFSNYYGYGLRRGRDGSIACNTRNGPGIKMVFEGVRRPYVVSVDFPSRACEALRGDRAD